MDSSKESKESKESKVSCAFKRDHSSIKRFQRKSFICVYDLESSDVLLLHCLLINS